MYNVISTGSKGNCVVYLDTIAVDMGVSFKAVESIKYELQIVLLTHIHGDHFNISTIKKLSFERPTLRFACGSFLKEYLEGIKNVDILEPGKIYDYGDFKISPVILYHDVQNFGYRIFKGDKKIIHCTDTYTLEGISAKNYDLYAIEHNHCEDAIQEKIKEKKSKGQFSYELGAYNSHLSDQKARDFIFKNQGENSQVLRLHESTNY